MIKAILFLSLYTIAGIGSWSIYSYIANEDTSLDALAKLANTQLSHNSGQQQAPAPQLTNIIYHWREYEKSTESKNTNYAELSFQNYEEELKFLQKLKENQDKALKKPTNTAPTENTENRSTLELVSKLFAEAKNIQHLINSRTEQINAPNNPQAE